MAWWNLLRGNSLGWGGGGQGGQCGEQEFRGKGEEEGAKCGEQEFRGKCEEEGAKCGVNTACILIHIPFCAGETLQTKSS